MGWIFGIAIFIILVWLLGANIFVVQQLKLESL